jgi:glycolate oxidase FAD binding subunit
VLELDAQAAQQKLAAWRRAAWPVSGACYADGRLHVRLEGGTGSVMAAARDIGGEALAASFWDDLREHRLPFFADPRPLWRLSLPVGTPLPSVPLPGRVCADWGGAQRWLKSDADTAALRAIAQTASGYATRFTPVQANAAQVDAHADDSPFAPLTAALLPLHQRLKQQLDPQRIFNPARLYPEL